MDTLAYSWETENKEIVPKEARERKLYQEC